MFRAFLCLFCLVGFLDDCIPALCKALRPPTLHAYEALAFFVGVVIRTFSMTGNVLLSRLHPITGHIRPHLLPCVSTSMSSTSLTLLSLLPHYPHLHQDSPSIFTCSSSPFSEERYKSVWPGRGVVFMPRQVI